MEICLCASTAQSSSLNIPILKRTHRHPTRPRACDSQYRGKTEYQSLIPDSYDSYERLRIRFRSGWILVGLWREGEC